jgi:hypothetical protein
MTEEVGTRIEPGILVLMDNGYCSDKKKCNLQRDQEMGLNSEHFAVFRGCPIGHVSHDNVLEMDPISVLFKDATSKVEYDETREKDAKWNRKKKEE